MLERVCPGSRAGGNGRGGPSREAGIAKRKRAAEIAEGKRKMSVRDEKAAEVPRKKKEAEIAEEKKNSIAEARKASIVKGKRAAERAAVRQREKANPGGQGETEAEPKQTKKKREPTDLKKLGKTHCTVDDLLMVRRNHARVSGLEMRLLEDDEHPWKAPPGWFTAYKFWFKESHMFFPLPKLFVAYCEDVGIAFSQLCPAGVRNITGTLVLAAELGMEIDLDFYESMSSIANNQGTPGTLYVSIKPKHAMITGHPSKTRNWINEY